MVPKKQINHIKEYWISNKATGGVDFRNINEHYNRHTYPLIPGGQVGD